jgi:opacity protein-like surface antigen
MKLTTAAALGAAFALAALSSAHLAAAGTLDGLFFGGDYGRSRSTYDPNFVNGQFQSAAAADDASITYGTPWVSRTSNAWWAHAGYWFGPNWGIDAAFLHLGEFKTSSDGTLETLFGSESLTSGAEVSSHGPAASLLGRLPLTEALEIDLRVGDYFGKTTETTAILLASQYSTQPNSATRSSLLVGAGAGYAIGNHFSIRLDYLFIARVGNSTVGKYNVSLPSVGFTFTL